MKRADAGRERSSSGATATPHAATENREFSALAARSQKVRVRRDKLSGVREVRRAVDDVGEERAAHGVVVACAAPLRIWMRCFWV
jgi:hypothetical protein